MKKPTQTQQKIMLFKLISQIETKSNKSKPSNQVVTYIRVSSKGQEIEGNKLHQQQECAEYCKENGLESVKEFSDTHTGTHNWNSNTEFITMLEFIRDTRKYDIVTLNLNRGGRNNVIPATIDSLRDANIEILFTDKKRTRVEVMQDTTKNMAYSEDLMENMPGWMDAQRQRGSRIAPLPRGLEKDELEIYVPEIKQHKKVIAVKPIAVTKEIYQTLFQSYASGVFITYRQGGEFLASHNILTKHGNRISDQSVKRILTNPIYCAKRVETGYSRDDMGKMIRTQNHEPKNEEDLLYAAGEALISQEIFIQVQNRLKMKHGSYNLEEGKEVHLLDGIAQCKCGGNIKWTRSTARGTTYEYYKCSRKGCKMRKELDLKAFTTKVLDILDSYEWSSASESYLSNEIYKLWSKDSESLQEKLAMRQSLIKNLQDNSNSIAMSLGNPHLSPENRTAIESQLQITNEKIKSEKIEMGKLTSGETDPEMVRNKVANLLTTLKNEITTGLSPNIETSNKLLRALIGHSIEASRGNEVRNTSNIVIELKDGGSLDTGLLWRRW